jgi:hypothetical protein
VVLALVILYLRNQKEAKNKVVLENCK